MWRFIFGSTFTKSATKVANKEMARLWKQLSALERDENPKGLNIESLRGNKNLFSLRISQGFRVIFTKHKDHKLIQLLFVGQHDESYRFAERVKLDTTATIGLSGVVAGGGIVGGIALGGFFSGIAFAVARLLPSKPERGFTADELFEHLRPGLDLSEPEDIG